MRFNYTEEQLAIQSMVEKFAQKELAPRAAEIDRTKEFPYDLYRKIGELGIIGMPHPQEVGGSGTDFLSYCLALEELGRADCTFGPTLTATTSVIKYILNFAKGAQRERWIEEYVKPIIRGEATGSVAVTEPNSSCFDMAATQTTALRKGDEYVINGNKMFSTCAGLENNKFAVVWAVTDLKERTKAYFIVPKGTKGYTVGRVLPKMGMRGSDTRELFFEDCRVPAENMLTPTVAGQSHLQSPNVAGIRGNHSRLTLASYAIGLHRHCLEESLSWAKQRVTYGMPLSERQLIQGWLAEMATDLEISRALRDRNALRYDQDEMTQADGSMVKLVCAENALKAANYATEIFGGMGFMEDVPVNRRYRDAKGLTLIQGGPTLHKWLIAKEMGC